MQHFQGERVRLHRLQRGILQRSFDNKPLLPAETPVFGRYIQAAESITDNRREGFTILRTGKEDICIVLILRNHGIRQVGNISRSPYHQPAGLAVILQRVFINSHTAYAGRF
ncbi:hypothetical protein D3C75_1090600 [compost metagenome]